MVGPITWRNVSNGAGSGAAQLLATAQAQTQRGFQALQDVLRDNTAEDRANMKVARDFNTAKFLDQVAGSDLATLQSAEGRAALDAQRQGYGIGIDSAGTRNAVDQRIAQLQQQQVAAGQFADTQQERALRPEIDNLRTLYSQKEYAKADKILDEKDFGAREGEVRRELAAQRDADLQRGYRANTEDRAVRQEQRTAASHALSMETGRENLNYNKAVHSEGLRKLNEDRTADALAMRGFEEQQSALQAQNALVADIARTNNVVLEEDGTIDMSKLEQDKKDTIAQQLRDSGAGNLTATAARQRLVQQGKEAGLSTAGQQLLLDRYDTVAAMDQLAPEDQERVQRESQAATRDITDTQTRLTDQYNRKATNNPFSAPPQDVNAEANKLVGDYINDTDNQWLTVDTNRRSAIETVTDLMQNGLSVTLDGKDVNIVVPPSLIKRAMLQNEDNVLFEEGGSWKTIIEDALKNDKGLQRQATEAQSLQQTYQNDMAKLSGQKLKIETSIVRARKKEKGVTVSSNDWVDAALRGKR